METEVFINSRSQLDRSRWDLEEDIEAFFGGKVEITGGGSGTMGWNIDLLIHHDGALESQIDALRNFLSNWGVPRDTSLSIISGEVQNAVIKKVFEE
ncbi:hypothetical protein [Prosthecobacter sp.]|uniref:hypothetical protein n=1 Tax=Prosthecobacter sp. TaxID=1965333 RepID=UPI003784BC71